MLTTTILLRWFIAIVVMVALLLGFYVLLRYLKENDFSANIGKKSNKNKMKVLETLYLDSKNKIVKVQDGNKIMTLLLGSQIQFVKEEKKKKENE